MQRSSVAGVFVVVVCCLLCTYFCGSISILSTTPQIVLKAPSSTRPSIVRIGSLEFNSSHVPVGHFELPFQRTVFAVLTDFMFTEERLKPQLETWLEKSAHTFLYFSDITQSREAGQLFEAKYAGNVTSVYLPVPDDLKTSPNGAWKNFLIVQDLAERLKRLQLKPDWVAIIDDDTYLLGPAVAVLLSPLTNSSRPIYAGHPVPYCLFCRNAKKKFTFAFGGNGIFLNSDALLKVAKAAPECMTIFKLIAGDERLGGCFKKIGIPLTSLEGGTETMFQALGDFVSVTQTSPFPFGFHRLKKPEWYHDMRRLELRHADQVLSWADIAEYFLVERRGVYSEALFYPERFDPLAIERKKYYIAQKEKAERSKRPKRVH